MVSKGKIDFTDIISKVSDGQILKYYLGINRIPCVICSPLRRDVHPSFGLYTIDGNSVGYKDFSTGESGSTLTLLKKYFGLDDKALYSKLMNDLNKISSNSPAITPSYTKGGKYHQEASNIELSCHIRAWNKDDIKYWESYGITIDWLKWCEVYPIDYKFIKKEGRLMRFKADKLAYAFIERKEGHITYKFYQPYNTSGYKWQNSHDRSVLGLWTKLPPKGDKMCICSSVKDALCLMSNLLIPCICLQGEGYPISNTALNVLRSRFKDIYICLDNDAPGLVDAQRDAEEYNFINVVIPQFDGGKDISDLYKVTNNKKEFIRIFKELFQEAHDDYYDELPF